MVRLLKQFLSSEKGQALPIVLAVLAIGGLTIAASLNYATTSLKGGRIIQEDTKGVYAAGAGVEHALWSLGSGEEPLTQLPQNINQMAVGIETLDEGIFTLYCGELMGLDPPPPHYDWLGVDGEVVCDEGTTCNYTITATWQCPKPDQKRKLIEIGAVLPMGYDCDDGSAASFDGNLSNDEPTSTGNTSGGARWLKWLWDEGEGPEITSANATQTQRFRITGTGSPEGDYTWLKAQSGDVGIVGEITGTRYRITATATRPEGGRTTAEIVAGIMIVGGDIHILSWQITK